jgi:hypothetical protein
MSVETLVLEHSFHGRPFDLERYRVPQSRNHRCLTKYGVKHVKSYLTPDRQRMICVFESPDAEAVRKLSAELGYSYDRVWRATVIDRKSGRTGPILEAAPRRCGKSELPNQGIRMTIFPTCSAP